MAINVDLSTDSGSFPVTPVSVPRPKALRQGARVTADATARREPVPRLLEYVSEHRLVMLIVLHALVLASIYWLCYVIRFDGAIPPAYLRVLVITLPLVVVLKVVILLTTGSLRGLWRQFTFADMTALSGTAALGSIGLTAVGFLNLNWLSIPHSIIVMDCGGTHAGAGRATGIPPVVPREFLPDVDGGVAGARSDRRGWPGERDGRTHHPEQAATGHEGRRLP